MLHQLDKECDISLSDNEEELTPTTQGKVPCLKQASRNLFSPEAVEMNIGEMLDILCSDN